MFCYQCEQTANGQGCTVVGVCGKDEETAALQDLLVHVTKGMAARMESLPKEKRPAGIAALIEEALFTTVTNVNFDPVRIEELIRGVAAAASISLPASRAELLTLAAEVGVAARRESLGDDVSGLQELLTYGVKGMAAYAHHARRLGYTDPAVDAFFIESLARLAAGEAAVDKLLPLNLKCGEVTLAVMALLDKAHTDTYGHPVPTKVRIGHQPGKAILVSGHDLLYLKELLKQTEGTGIRVYTHGEMLPAHGYPELHCQDRKSTRLNSSHEIPSRMPSSA